MSEVTYYVALPFVAADDGIAAGEPTECFNPSAAVMRAEAAFAQGRPRGCGRLQPYGRSCYRRFQRRQGDQEVPRRSG